MVRPVGFRHTACVNYPLKKGEDANGVPWEDDGLFRLDRLFVAEYDLSDHTTLRITGQPGFVLNFRSGPAFVDLVLPKSGPAAAVWCAHDIPYNDPDVVSQRLVDLCMDYGLRCVGIDRFRARLARWAVGTFGRGAYTHDTLQVRRGMAKVERISWDAAAISSPLFVGLRWQGEYGR